MSNDSVFECVKAWWARERYAWMELPDRIFGGIPGEGQHRLTYLTLRPRKLIIELDEQLVLTFTECTRAENLGDVLVLSDFTQLVFDWEEYGQLVPHAEVFTEGTVKFNGP